MRLWLVAVLVIAQAAAATPEAEFFESKVRPILAGRCYGCHAETETAGLRLDSRASLLEGGRSGPAIHPGDPAGSILLHAVQGIKGRMGMPPSGQRLESHQIEALEQWIGMGAPWPMSPREFFQARVKPVLEAKCLGCHVSEPQGGLRMDSREALLKGGKSGPALVKGDPDASLLVKSLRYQHDLKMPPTGALPANEIEDIVRWIADGAVWEESAGDGLQPYEISEEHRQHWAFQPLWQGAVPALGRRRRIRQCR